MLNVLSVMDSETKARVLDSNLRTCKGRFESVFCRRPVGMKKSYDGPTVYRCSIMGIRASGDQGVSYANVVNGQRDREDKFTDFMVKPRVWGVRREDSTLIDHKGNVYASMIVGNVRKVWFETNDAEVSYESIAPFLLAKEKKETRVRDEARQAERQGVEKAVKFIDVKMGSIVWIKFNGLILLDAQALSSATAASQKTADEEIAASN